MIVTCPVYTLLTYFYLLPFSFCLRRDVIMPHRFNLSRRVAVLMNNLSNRVSKKNPRALILSAVLAVFCVAQVFVSASAQDKLPAPSGSVNDFAGVVDPATKQRLDTVLQSLKTRTDVDLVIAVVKTAGPADMYDYS